MLCIAPRKPVSIYYVNYTTLFFRILGTYTAVVCTFMPVDAQYPCT